MAAKGDALGRKEVRVPVRADDPITDAWRAKVNAEIRAAAKESLNIPLDVADTDRFRAQVADTLAGMKGLAREQIPLEAVDADRFKVSVLTAVAEARAEIKALTRPVADATPSTVSISALNPLDAAWRQQVEASIKAISKDALKIPIDADTTQYRADLGAQLDQIRTSVRQDIRANLTDADKFKADTLKLVQEIQAGVRAKIPVEVDEQKARASGANAGFTMGQAIAGGVALAGPLVAGAAVGVGVTALAGLGAAIQHGDSRIQAGWTQLATDAKFAGQSASAGIVAPFASAMGQIDQLVRQEQPTFRELFQSAGQDIAPLTAGLTGLVQNALPGLDNAIQHSMPIAQGLAQVEKDTGTAIGVVGNAVSANSALIGRGFTQAGGTVKAFGGLVGDAIGITSHLAGGVLPVLNAALGGADTVLHGTNSALGPLIAGFGSMGTVAAVGVLGLKAMSAAGSGVTSLYKGVQSGASSLASGIVNLGSRFESSSPALANMALKAGSVTESLGPIGLLGAAGAATIVLGALSKSQEDAAHTAQDQADAAMTVAQALRANNGLVDGSTRASLAASLQGKDWVKTLTDQGISLKDITDAALGVPGALKKVQDAVGNLGGAHTVADNLLKGVSGGLLSNSDAANKAKDALGVLDGVYGQATQDNKQFAAAQGDVTTALQKGTTATNAYQTDWNNVANAVAKTPDLFMQASAGVKALTDATVAADTGFFSAQSSFAQLDQAVAQAQHSTAQSALGVASARHSEQQAVVGVTQAQTVYRQSLQAEQQAQAAVGAARKAAQQELEDLQRQVTDAADTQDEAQVRLLDAQNAVNDAGLQNRSLASLGPLSSGNEKQFQLLLSLREAQHNLNDVNAQGAQLADQNAQAQAAGVNGSQGVVSAQQQLVSSQQQVAQASLALKDAQYAEQQAHQAVRDAQYQEGQASQQLRQAKEADSRSTDLNTAAGARNFTSIEQMFDANYKATGSVQLASAATENQATKLGFTKLAVDNVVGSLTGLDGKTAQFGIVGQPSVDISKIVAAAVQQGIDPEGLGFSPHDVQNALGGPPKHGTIHPFAAGGAATGSLAVVGEYGPEVLRLPVGSQVYPAANVAGALDGVPGFASGGITSALIRANLRLGTWGGAVAATGDTYSALGYRNIPQLPAANPPSPRFGGGFSGGSSSAGLTPNRAANKAIMQQVFAGFGWGSGPEWAAQDYVEMREAGYNNVAQNPTSTAFGMGQLLNGTWASTGVAKTTDPALQSLAMAIYERNRYGHPIAAAAHERAYNWYAAGGPASGGRSVVGEHGPEVVRLPSGGGGRGSSGPFEVKVVIDIGGNSDTAFISMFKALVRTGQIRFTANGSQVAVA